MDISCDIIRDLLPLYAEELVSEDSKKLVDEHLCTCDPCTKQLGILKKAAQIPVEANPESLKKVKKTIDRRRILSMTAAVLSVITLASLVITYLFSPFQLTCEQALDAFYIREDGGVVIDYSSAVVGRMRIGKDDNWYLLQYSTRYDMWKGENRKSIEELYGSDGVITEEERQRYENIDIVYGKWISSDGKTISNAPIPGDDGCRQLGDADKNWWYSDPKGLGNHTLLHDAGKAVPERPDSYSPVYPLLFFGGILMVLLISILRRFIKKEWMRELSVRFLILSSSAVFSTFFVSSGSIFTSTTGIIDQYWGWMIGMNTVLLTLTALLWNRLHLLNKQDKGL